MASTLYQKLHNADVIPRDYTAIRNIINRFSEHNDGYKVLYAMLELVHPASKRMPSSCLQNRLIAKMIYIYTINTLMHGYDMKYMLIGRILLGSK
jgi:hypothetical protein